MNILAGIRPAPERAANAIPAITTKIASSLYSAFKKANAPAWMYPANFCIRSLPASCLRTQEAFANITTNPIRASSGTM